MSHDNKTQDNLVFLKKMAEFEEKLKDVPLAKRPAIIKIMIEDEGKSPDAKKLVLCEQDIDYHAKAIENLGRLSTTNQLVMGTLSGAGLLMTGGSAIFSLVDFAISGGCLTCFTLLVGGATEYSYMGAMKSHRQYLATAEEEKQDILKSLSAPMSPEPPQIPALLKLAGPANAFNAGKTHDDVCHAPPPAPKGYSHEPR